MLAITYLTKLSTLPHLGRLYVYRDYYIHHPPRNGISDEGPKYGLRESPER